MLRRIANSINLRRIVRRQLSVRNNGIYKFQRISSDNSFRPTYRQFTSEPENLPEVDFNEFKNSIEDKKTVIIDVREPEELQESGSLPRSINIPLGDLETAFRYMSDHQFLEKYGHKKPHKETPIIFSCFSGKRSFKAQLIAKQLDYTNVMNYTGGWSEWAEQSKK